jgi:hypothetical protein
MMGVMARKGKRSRDTNQLAKWILDQPSEQLADLNAANNPAQDVKSLGGLTGGKARATSLTSKKRREIARKANSR